MAKKRKVKKIEISSSPEYIWCIAYIHRDFLDRVQSELKRYKYDIETYIPTVRVIKKKFKGKNMFEFVPLLFNYGFFKIPYKDACNPDFLMELRSRITCIYGWVKDPAYTVKNSKVRLNDSDKALPASAFAKDKEIAKLIKTSGNINIYSEEDLDKLKPGDYIELKGYPFENMPAEIISINNKKKEVRVSLLLDVIVKEITVSFENVFYTMYNGGYDDSLTSDISYDELNEKSNRGDRAMYKSNNYEEN